MVLLGTKIKKLRELRNFTQAYLAERLDITQPTYSRYEKDELHFSDEMLEKLSKVFGLSIEAMLSFEVDKLFLYIESVCNCEQFISAKEQKLAEELITQLKQENSDLRASLDDLRQVIQWFKISHNSDT